MAHKYSKECFVGTKKYETVPRDHFWSKEWVKSEPEYHKYAVNSSHLWAILSHSKRYQMSVEVLMMTVGTKKIKKLPRNLFGSKECVISMPAVSYTHLTLPTILLV